MMVLFAATAAAVWGIDRLIKFQIVTQFVLNQPVPVWPPVFYLTHVQNRGAAFGLFPALSQIYLVIGVLVSVTIAAYMIKNRSGVSRLVSVAMGLIGGGTISNLGDRALRGAVIDYLDFRFWPVFNIADIAINVGVALLLFAWWRTNK